MTVYSCMKKVTVRVIYKCHIPGLQYKDVSVTVSTFIVVICDITVYFNFQVMKGQSENYSTVCFVGCQSNGQV